MWSRVGVGFLVVVVMAAVVVVGSPNARAAPKNGEVERDNAERGHSPRMEAMLAEGGARAPAGGRVRGVDVASHQHPGGASINWRRVARGGYRFAGVKASEGRYYANPHYSKDRRHARRAGMYVFAYHFAIPNVSGGAAQAEYFLDRAGYRADGRTLNPVLDIEWNPYVSDDHTDDCYGLSKKRMIRWIRGFVNEIERRTGAPAMIYTAAGWWNQCTGGTSAFARNPLWVASIADRPTLPGGWSKWTIWQHGQTTVRGIKARTDVNYVNGGMRTLARLARGR